MRSSSEAVAHKKDWRRWSKADEEFVRANFGNTPAWRMHMLLERRHSVGAINSKAWSLKVKPLALLRRPGLQADILLLLTCARYPLSSPVIAMSINRSMRQTQRVLAQLVDCGLAVREFRSGEGRRNPLYELRAAA